MAQKANEKAIISVEEGEQKVTNGLYDMMEVQAGNKLTDLEDNSSQKQINSGISGERDKN